MQYAESYYSGIAERKISHHCNDEGDKKQFRAALDIRVAEVGGYSGYEYEQCGKERLCRHKEIQQPQAPSPIEEISYRIERMIEYHTKYSKTSQLIKKMYSWPFLWFFLCLRVGSIRGKHNDPALYH